MVFVQTRYCHEGTKTQATVSIIKQDEQTSTYRVERMQSFDSFHMLTVNPDCWLPVIQYSSPVYYLKDVKKIVFNKSGKMWEYV
jgi:hypothetical protein